MSNKKFSEFTLQTDSSNVAFVVGFNGSDNVRISPSNLIGSGFLPTSGGTMTGNLLLQDNIQVQVGTGADLKIFHNGTDSFIENQTGILKIQSSLTDGDISFIADNGSGGTTEYFRLDGSSRYNIFSKDLYLIDNVTLRIGTGNDLRIRHDATDSYIENYTNDFIIRQRANDKDIIFQNDDGSGGHATYFKLDGSSTDIQYFKDLLIADNVKANFGNSNDLQIFHDGTDSTITNAVGDLIISNDANDKDIIFKSDTGGGGLATYFRLDGSNERLGVDAPNGMLFSDNIKAKFGAGGDMELYHDGSHSYVKQGGTGDLYIQQFRDDGDIVFQSDDGSGGMATYMTVDGSTTKVTLQKDLRADDGVKIQVGSSGDLFMVHESDTSKITNGTGQLEITQNVADEDIVFKADGGSGSAVEYMRLDGSQTSIRMKRQVKWDDNIKATFGDSDDLQIYHDGSDSYIQQTGTGDLIIENTTDDKDIKLKSDDGSGGTEIYINVDGSARATKFINPTFHNDSVRAKFGNDGDLAIYHTGANSIIENITGVLKIQSSLTDGDISFIADDGSGGTTEYFRLDGSLTINRFFKNTRLDDSVQLQVGSGADLQISHDGTDSLISNATGNLTIKNSADDKDIIFQSDDGSGGVTSYFELDGSDVVTKFRKNLYLLDNVGLKIGNSFDLDIKHDGSDSFIANATGHLYIKNSADDKDIIFQSDDGSGGMATYFFLDGSQADGTYRYIDFPDNSVISLGDNDAAIFHDGTDTRIKNETGDLFISQFANDKDIVFRNDDGSGGVAEYFRVDGGENRIVYSIDGRHLDNVKSMYGSGADLQIYHDGSNSFIQDSGTGRLNILTNQFRVLNSANSEILIDANENSAVDLYHNNVKKFATTSSGVEVTGFTDGSLADTGAGYNDGVVRFHNTTTATSGGSSVMNIRNSYGAGFGGLIKFWKADTSSSVGNIAFNTDTTAVNYNTTSDYRLKEDLQDFAGIDLIQRMKVYDYKWINYESRSYGVLAHELQEVLPGAVTGEKDDEEMQGVDYSKVVPVLIKAIQELKAEIQELKTK